MLLWWFIVTCGYNHTVKGFRQDAFKVYVTWLVLSKLSPLEHLVIGRLQMGGHAHHRVHNQWWKIANYWMGA